MQENAVSRKSRSKFFPKVICLLSARSLRGHICETIWNLTLKFWRHIFEYISNRMRWLSKNWFFLPSKPGSPLKGAVHHWGLFFHHFFRSEIFILPFQVFYIMLNGYWSVKENFFGIFWWHPAELWPAEWSTIFSFSARFLKFGWSETVNPYLFSKRAWMVIVYNNKHNILFWYVRKEISISIVNKIIQLIK